jgi:hypothetical protein
MYLSTISIAILLSFTHSSHAQSQSTPPCACCHEKAKQFHFWVGDWEAYNPKGKLAGTNRIVLLEGNCVMQENWIAASGGYTGTSYNFYNTTTGKWQQLWLDNQGGNLQLEGEWKGTAMVLEGKPTKNRQGQQQIDRITWTPNADGTVRQVWEASVDGGTSWTVTFDGVYRRK